MKNYQKYYPTILSFGGVVGTVATAILAAKATPKAMRLVHTESRLNHDGDAEAYTIEEAIKSAWKCYIPTVFMGGATIACILGSNAISKRNQASLSSAYAFVNESYKRYREAAKSIYGVDADKRIKAQMAKDVYLSSDGFSLYNQSYDSSEQCLFYESFSGQYFTSTMASVIDAHYHVNRNFMLRGVVYLEEYYEFLGLELEPKVNLDEWGWCAEDLDCYMWIDFNSEYTVLEDGMECYILSSAFTPKYIGMDY